MDPESTSWNLIRDAAAGGSDARARFATRYAPVIRRSLTQRWNGGPLAAHVEDAMQEVFVECLKEGGVLQRADPDAGPAFRAYLAGLVRNVALRVEERAARERVRRDPEPIELDQQQGSLTTVSQTLDRDWARAIVREAAAEQGRRAAEIGAKALLRVELLRMRFEDDLPPREIAERLGIDPGYLHHQLAKARRDFERALTRVLRRRAPEAGPADLAAQRAQLMDLLR